MPLPESDVDVSVVVPVKDGMPELKEQLAALCRQSGSFRWEVLVCDNGSTDDVAEYVRQLSLSSPRIRLVDASERPGAGTLAMSGQVGTWQDRCVL